MNIVACVARREWNVTSSWLILFLAVRNCRWIVVGFRTRSRCLTEWKCIVSGSLLGAEPVYVFPDETANRGGDGHDSVTFRGLRLVESVFAQVVRILRHGVPHVQQSVFAVDVPELQSADLSDAQPAH